MNIIKHFIGGKVIDGTSHRKGQVFNPATGEQESEVVLATKSDLDKAKNYSLNGIFTDDPTIKNV